MEAVAPVIRHYYFQDRPPDGPVYHLLRTGDDARELFRDDLPIKDTFTEDFVADNSKCFRPLVLKVLEHLLQRAEQPLRRKEFALDPALSAISYEDINGYIGKLRTLLRDGTPLRILINAPSGYVRFNLPVTDHPPDKGKQNNQRLSVETDLLLTTQNDNASLALPDHVGGPREPITSEAQNRVHLIDREPQRERILSCLDEAIAGRGGIVMIAGEDGVGKRHLVAAILEEARQRGADTNIGRCYEKEGSPAYMPFIEMLEHTKCTTSKADFLRVLGNAASEIAELMPALGLRRIYPEIPEPIRLPAENLRLYLFNSYREFIKGLARSAPRVLVLVFEALHWADEPTLRLLLHIVQIVPSTRMLVISTYCPEELVAGRPFAAVLEDLLRQTNATQVSLSRLRLEGVHSLLAAMSGQSPPTSVAQAFFDQTGGNPLFVKETFHSLNSEGELFDGTGMWRSDLPLDQAQMPHLLQLVLDRRLDRASSNTQRILTVCALVGHCFSLSLVKALENADPDAALVALEEAERAHLVSPVSAQGPEMQYLFEPELVRQRLLERLSSVRKPRLHGQVVKALEAVYGADLDTHASQLAYHSFLAGGDADTRKTVGYLWKAAQMARSSAAHEEALANIEKALSFLRDETSLRVAQLISQKGDALLALGRAREAIDNFTHAIEVFADTGALSDMAELSRKLATIQGWMVDHLAASRTIDRALDRLSPHESHFRLLRNLRAAGLSNSGDVAGAVRLRQDLGVLQDDATIHFYVHSMQYERAATMARHVADSSRARGDLWDAAQAEWICLFALHCGRPREAEKELPGCIELAEKVGHHDALRALKLHSASLAAARGDLKSAEREAEDAWTLGEKLQSPYNFLTDIARGTIAFLRGDPNKAERWYRYRSKEPPTHRFGAKDSSFFWLLAELNDERAGITWEERLWRLPKAGQLNSGGAWAALERSVVGLALMGRTEQAAALRPLTEELVATGVWMSQGMSSYRTAAGIAAACAGDWAAAEEHHLTAIHQMATAPYLVAQPIAREWYARMLFDRNSQGDAQKARGLLLEALAMYESMEMPFHAKRTSEKIGQF